MPRPEEGVKESFGDELDDPRVDPEQCLQDVQEKYVVEHTVHYQDVLEGQRSPLLVIGTTLQRSEYQKHGKLNRQEVTHGR